VTFKDLQKVIESQPALNQNQLQKLRGKPFWIWDKTRHRESNSNRVTKGECCMQHIIGLCKKDGIEKPFYDYEKELYKALMIPGYLNSNPKFSSHSADSNNIMYPFKEKHLWVIKATGLGISTFILRFMAWLCLYNDDYKDSQMVIVTGPNIDLAIKLIRRMKAMFADKLGVTFDSKETVLELNGCSIQAYPSNHIDSFRSLDNPKFLMLDELDFIPKFQQEDVRAVAERYIAKSNPYIVMVSTPNAPGGLFDTIQKEPLETCLYKKFFLDYLWGINKIYTEEEIANAKLSPSFPREYQLQYQGLIGNVFSTQSIENATKIQYNPDNINPSAKKSIALDPGFGSSNFAIVATQFVDGKIQVIFAEEYERPNFQAMINRVWEIKQKCGYISNVYVDASSPEIVQALKREFNEPFNQQYIVSQFTDCKKYNLHIEDRMLVVPVPFSVEGAHMLQHAKWLMEETDEDGSSLIAIHKDRFEKLVTALRTAVANEYKLDKEVSIFNDLLDAFRLSLQFYKRTK
jgi:hypothetical protein